MSFPRYPKYKDSGVEWLGEVPGHWSLKPLWTFFRRVKRTGFEDEQLLSVYRDYGVVPKASRNDNFNKPSDDLSVYQLVVPGDLAINKMKAWQGSVAISEHRGIVSPAYFIYEALHDASNRYLHYLMRSPRYITGYMSVSKGIRVNQWDLEPQLHSRIPLAVPSIEEQTQIAAFLDRETLKIDALVAEQRRLIELLKEKRQAVISHAVTKGLNPDAPMKPSGIEWLGDVPAHWEVMTAKRVSTIFVPQRNKPDLNTNGDGFFWVTMEQMRTDELASTEVCVSESAAREAGSRVLKAGAVVASCVGTFGIAVINQVDVIINQQLQAFVPAKQINTKFLRYFVAMSGCYFEQVGTAATLVYVNQEGFENMPIALPPKEEQKLIVAFLSSQTTKLDTLTTEAQRAIDLLQERRSALIAAAVTGQMDVRQHEPLA